MVVSIRPEAFRINAPDGHNTLFGRVESSTYLGETAQLVAELAGGARVKVSMLNPGSGTGTSAGAGTPGEKITLAVSPEDVVLLER
jgi:hypothetical protein